MRIRGFFSTNYFLVSTLLIVVILTGWWPSGSPSAGTANQLTLSGKPLEGHAALSRLLADQPGDASLRGDRGLALLAFGLSRGAVQEYTRALADDSQRATLYRARALAYLGLCFEQDEAAAGKSLTLALDDLTEAATRGDDEVAVRLLRGNVYLAQKQAALALEEFDGVLQRQARLPEAVLGRALVLNLQGEREPAVEEATRGLDQVGRLESSRRAQGLITRGIIRREAGDAAGSLKDCEEALRLVPEHAPAYLNRGLARRVLRQPEADDDFHEALRRRPDLWSPFKRRYAEVTGRPHESRLEGRPVGEWLARLADVDETARDTLGRHLETIRPELLHALHHGEQKVRRALVIQFGTWPGGDARIVPHLIAATHEDDPETRLGALLALGELGPQAEAARPELIDALGDPSPDARTAAAYALGKMLEPTPRTVAALAQALGDPNAEVAAQAAHSLGQMGISAKKALPDLEKACESRPALVAANATTALAGIKEASRLDWQRRLCYVLLLLIGIGPAMWLDYALRTGSSGLSSTLILTGLLIRSKRGAVLLVLAVAGVFFYFWGIQPEFYATLGQIVIPLGVLVLFLRPPLALVLTTTTGGLMEGIAQSLFPFRAVALLDGKRVGPVSFFSLQTDNLRTIFESDWEGVVRRLIDTVPLVIVDTRVASDVLIFETGLMLEPARRHKAIFVICDDGSAPTLTAHDAKPGVGIRTVRETDLEGFLRAFA